MNNDFEPACRRMEWLDPFYKQIWEKAFADGIPISGTFELTPRCNFNCKMCYVHLKAEDIPKHGKEMNAAEWLRIAREAKAAGTTWLCITGGEPLLHPEFETIWRGLAEMGFFLTLQTNASLISGKVVDLLEQYPPRQVKITLYGSNDEVYKAVCGVENGFTRVNDGIHTLMSMGIPVTLVSTIIRQNVEDVQKMAFYAYRHRLPWASTGGIKPSLRGADTDAAAVRVQENLEAAARAGIERRIREKKFIDPNRKPATYCKDYRLGYWVLWDGMMRFCSFLDEPNIPVRSLPFAEAWRQLLDYEEQLDWPAECKTCEAARVCLKCMAAISGKGTEQQINGVPCHTVQMFARQANEHNQTETTGRND